MLADAVLITLQFMTTVSSIVVAAWVGLSVVKSHEDQRLHNRLSVRPIIHVFVSIDLDGCFLGIEICNNGVGPAILEDVRLVETGAVYVPIDPLLQSAHDIAREFGCKYKYRGTVFKDEHSLPVNERFVVGRVTFCEGESTRQALDSLKSKVLQDIQCKVRFRTIYDECHEYVGL